MPASLIAFLQANPNCYRADLFAINLPNGDNLFVTSGQWDISVPAGTPGWTGALGFFRATQYGLWSRGAITSEAGTSCTANTMALTCVPNGATYPGTPLGIQNAALNHLFDGATVTVYTVYMPIGQYGNVSAGVETKFIGTVTKIPGLSRLKVDFECADPMFLLNMKVPSRLYQSNCGWSFADANCTLDATKYTVSFAVGNGVTQRTLPSGTLTQPNGYFTQGVVKCVTGANAGLSQTVKAFAGSVITVTVPWLLPVAPGDTFSVIKGCDKTPSTCAATTRADGTAEPADYRVRFGGTPLVPAPSSSL
jgi:hypothetical protein